MQAGFALLTCGLIRKKNAAHLMMLNFAAYVFAFLAYYAVGYAFQFGAVALNNAPSNIGGTPTLNQFLLGSGAVGIPRRQGVLPDRPRLRRQRQHDVPVPGRLHGDGRLHHRRIDLRAHHVRRVSAVRAVRRARSCIRSSVAGCGAAAGCRSSARRWAWATATSISPVRPWSTRSAASAPWRSPSCSGPGSANTRRTASRWPFPRTTWSLSSPGTFILLFGWMGFNPGIDAGRHRPADLGRGGQHEPGGGRRARRRRCSLWYLLFEKPDITMACNGMLAGLVAITAPCAFVSSTSAVMIGIDRRRAGVRRACCSTSAC